MNDAVEAGKLLLAGLATSGKPKRTYSNSCASVVLKFATSYGVPIDRDAVDFSAMTVETVVDAIMACTAITFVNLVCTAMEGSVGVHQIFKSKVGNKLATEWSRIASTASGFNPEHEVMAVFFRDPSGTHFVAYNVTSGRLTAVNGLVPVISTRFKFKGTKIPMEIVTRGDFCRMLFGEIQEDIDD